MLRAVVLFVVAGLAVACGDDSADVDTSVGDGTTASTTSTAEADEVTVAVDASRGAGGELVWTVVLTNGTDVDLDLRFRDGQRADIAVLGDDGAVRHRWSDGRSFTQAIMTETVPAGQTISYELADDTFDLDPGRHRVEATVTSAAPYRVDTTVEVPG